MYAVTGYLILVAALMLTHPAHCMSVTAEITSNAKFLAKLEGPIRAGDAEKVRKLFEQSRDPQPYIYLDSPGGDVQEAMAIGKVLRANEAVVSIGKCASSCVLILAGGVQRRLNFSNKDGGVGLHRLYFSRLSPSVSTEAVTAQRRKVLTEVSEYLRSMNVTQQLLEMMEAIPPESIRYLTEQEATNLGLSAPDPVWDERDVARQAADRGTTSMEFRRRRAQVDPRCFRFAITDGERYLICEEATLLGLSTKVYRERYKTYKAWWSAVREKHDGLVTSAMKAAASVCWTRIVANGEGACPVI